MKLQPGSFREKASKPGLSGEKACKLGLLREIRRREVKQDTVLLTKLPFSRITPRLPAWKQALSEF